MVIKEISKAIADMFGIELKDYNSGIASQEGIYDGIADSVDDATKKVKELKRQTFGWDEIHNINENKDSGLGTDISGGIDQRLLDAIKGYDNGMDKVRMKASQIRDDIMKWLGFTKEIDPLTGEVSFKYQGVKTTLKNMWNSLEGLSTQGKILVGLGLVTGAVKLWNTGKKLNTTFGNTGLIKTTKSLISPMSSLFNWMKLGVQVNGNFNAGLKDGVEAWRKQNILVTKADGSLNKWKTTMNGAKIAVKSLITGAVGLSTVHESMKNLSTEGLNLANTLGLVGGSLGTIASGVQIGSIFGGWGPVIGGAVGAIASLISALNGYQTETDKMISKIKESTNEVNEYSNNLLNQYDEINKKVSNETSLITVHQNLLSELKQIVDENGKINEGYEDRATFITTVLNQAYGTELKISNNKIQNFKEELESIEKIINKKKEQILLESLEESYTLALKEKTKAYKNLASAQDNMDSAYAKLTEYEKRLKEEYEKSSKVIKNKCKTFEQYKAWMLSFHKPYQELFDATYQATIALNAATDAYDANTNAIMNYEGLITAISKEDAEAIEFYTNKVENSYNDGTKFINLTYEERLKDAIEYHDSVYRIAKEKGEAISEQQEIEANSRLETIKKDLIKQSQTIKDLTPEIIEAWKYLAENSTSEFTESFEDLPTEIQNELLPKLKLTGSTLGNALSSGIKFDGSNIYKGWNTTVTKLWDTSSKIASQVGSALGIKLPPLSSLKISVPAYANGGIPEDGLFFANHNELVGKFSNGKTAVANNLQIESGIEEAAYRGYMRAIHDSGMNGGQASEIDVHVHTDEGTVIDRIEQRTKQTGQFPFTIPTY